MRLQHLAPLLALAACGIDVTGTLVADAPPTPGGPGDPSSNDGGPGATGGQDASAPPPDGGADAVIPDASLDAPVPHAGFAVSLSGNAYVAAGTVTIPTDFTLEAWVFPKSAQGETYIAAKDQRNQGNGQFRLGLLPGGKLFFLMTDSGGDDHGLYDGEYKLTSPAAVPLSRWSHVAVTKAGATFTLLIDGAAVATRAADASFTHGAASRAFRIGARIAPNGSGADGSFDGDVDQVRLFTVARAAAEIAADMRRPLGAGDAVFASVRAAWRFDEGAGTTAADDKAAFPGTLTGGATWTPSTAY